MNTEVGKIVAVQPIRDLEALERVKRELLGRSYRDWFLFVLGLNTGFRIGDLLTLRVFHVKGKSHIDIIEGKTRKRRVFPINSVLRPIIDEYIRFMPEEHLLFSGDSNGTSPLDRGNCYKTIQRAAKAAGLKNIGTHSMRKTFGYHFYYRNDPDSTAHSRLRMLMEILNHRDEVTTLRYIGVFQDQVDKELSTFNL